MRVHWSYIGNRQVIMCLEVIFIVYSSSTKANDKVKLHLLADLAGRIQSL